MERTNGDRVDEARVGHVRQVGHCVWCAIGTLHEIGTLREIGLLYFSPKKVSNMEEKVSDEVIFGVIYLRSSGTSVFVVVVP